MINSAKCAYALMGVDGVGKTSMAGAIARHYKITKCFRSRIHWIQCTKVVSVTHFLEVLFEALEIQQADTATLEGLRQSIIAEERYLIIFDNFEKVCSLAERERVKEILAALDSFNLVSILVTMRGDSAPPNAGITWTTPQLAPLPTLPFDAARKTFLAANAAGDSQLQVLNAFLRELDCLPLAVSLMAQVAERTRQTPSELLDRWKRGSTSTQDPHHDPSGKLDRSIQLAVDAHFPRWKSGFESDTLELLSIISFLPEGLSEGILRRIVQQSPGMRIMDLLSTPLAHQTGDVVDVLASIRSFVLRNHPPSPSTKRKVYQAFYDLVNSRQQSLQPGDGFTDTIACFRGEGANILYVLLDAVETEKSDTALSAALNYVRYLDYTRPSSELAEACVRTARGTESSLLADCLRQLGDILITLNQYERAETLFTDAISIYSTTSNMYGEAKCRQCIAFIRYMEGEYDASQREYNAALSGFRTVGDVEGIVDCETSIGSILVQQRQFDNARLVLDRALTDFSCSGNIHGAAGCYRKLGEILAKERNYEEAIQCFQVARDAYRRCFDELGVASTSWLIGDTLRVLRRHEDAEKQLRIAMKQHSYIEVGTGVAACNQSLGELCRVRGRYREAISYLELAVTQFDGDDFAIAECRRSLGAAHLLVGMRQKAQTLLTESLTTLVLIGDPLAVAECHRMMGMLLHSQMKHEEALTHFLDAFRVFEDFNDPLGAAQCLHGLGETLLSQKDYTGAWQMLQDAQKRFEVIGDLVGQTQCYATLGHILLLQRQHRQARESLRQALKGYEQLRDPQNTVLTRRRIPGKVAVWVRDVSARARDRFLAPPLLIGV